MPQPFYPLTIEEFAHLLEEYPFTRRINAVHMHHTWRPNHVQDKGHDSVVSMWRYHTQTLGWSDIAQHVTIDKKGTIWTGRNWNQPPASASGHNGNPSTGPFMFELIGDFDRGKDPFDGNQRQVALNLIALVQRRFNLSPESLFFHNQMSGKSCPGTAVNYSEVIAEVKKIHASFEKNQLNNDEQISSTEPFGREALVIREVLRNIVHESPLSSFSRTANLQLGPTDAELPEHHMSREHLFQLSGGETTEESRGDRARGTRLTPIMLSELRPHVVNLTEGHLSSNGSFQTDTGDIKAIFGEHLPNALKQAQELEKPLHLVFYAHGGLVSEGKALEAAYSHVHWWKQHPNVYPIYFVWETGLFETLGQMLDSRSRDLKSTRTAVTDKLIEDIVRVGNIGPKVWLAMKQSAALASSSEGGAFFVAKQLHEFLEKYNDVSGKDTIQLHCVGHSAGAIFHRHFIPTALKIGVPSFNSLHYLAPAIRVDEFMNHVAPLLGEKINHLSLFTMRKDLELADNCRYVYRKSLLYLIYHALEREKQTPILGLEESLRGDLRTEEVFGLAGALSSSAEIIFSKSSAKEGRSASHAISHGGFDNDASTMESVLRRILDMKDTEEVAPFPNEDLRGIEEWGLPEQQGEEISTLVNVLNTNSQITTETPSFPINPSNVKVNNGKKRALCVGINAYPTQPLAGCVADAKAWAGALEDLGFKTDILLDENATRQIMLDHLQRLVSSGQPGDVLAFQFSGHGTFFSDEDGDEQDKTDEAFCPVDLHTGAVILDDEIRELFAQLPNGVNLTCFIDCCHSGSITRFALRPGTNERPREIIPTPQMKSFYKELKNQRGKSRLASSQAAHRDITFSACQPHELAWESNGKGEFTVRGVQVLRENGISLTNKDFYDAVVKKFGPSPRQTPFFDAIEEARNRGLLLPLVSGSPDGAKKDMRRNALVLDEVRQLVQQLDEKLSSLI